MSIAFAASPRVGHIDVAPTRYGWPYCTRVWSRLASKLTSGTSTRARLTGQFAVALKACPTKGPKDSALSLTQSLPCRRRVHTGPPQCAGVQVAFPELTGEMIKV